MSYLNDWYQTYLGRDPDPEGLAFWQNYDGPDKYGAFQAAVAAKQSGGDSGDVPGMPAPIDPDDQRIRLPDSGDVPGMPAPIDPDDQRIRFPDSRMRAPDISVPPSTLGQAVQVASSGFGPSVYDFSNDPVDFEFSNANYQRRDDSVVNRLNEITQGDSALMKQARTAGLQQANQRGLLNSSMAVGAAQDSAFRAALPVAAQEAQQAAAENLLMAELGSREKLAVAEIAAAKERLGIELTAREKIAFAEMAEAKIRLGMQITSAEKIAAQQLAGQMAIANAQIASASQIANAQLSSAQYIAQMNAETSRANVEAQIQAQLQADTIRSDTTLAINTMSAVSNADSVLQSSLANINANTGMPADARDAAITAAYAQYDNTLNLVQQISTVDLNWTTASGQTTNQIRQQAPADRQSIDALYRDLLGRPADAEGIAFFTGAPLNQVRSDILGSAEYLSR